MVYKTIKPFQFSGMKFFRTMSKESSRGPSLLPGRE